MVPCWQDDDSQKDEKTRRSTSLRDLLRGNEKEKASKVSKKASELQWDLVSKKQQRQKKRKARTSSKKAQKRKQGDFTCDG